MNPLDRIAQLTEENRQLLRSVDELRAQVETARQELARESATISKLAKDKRELVSMVSLCASEFASLAPYLGNVCGTWESTQEKAETTLIKFGPVDRETVNEFLSRHA